MDDTAGPAVVWANWYRFRSRERIRHERVMSVCFLWSLGGTGTVRSHGRSFTLDVGSVLRLPWDHDVEYVADEHSPFRLGTVHVVPRHRTERPVLLHVAHQPGDLEYQSPDRAGDPGDPGRPVLAVASSVVARRVASLGRYAVERFGASTVDESTLRSLGALFSVEGAAVAAAARATSPRVSGARVAGGSGIGGSGTRRSANEAGEIRVAADGGGTHVGDGLGDGSLPPALEAMTTFVTQHLDQPLAVADVAAAGDCSASTAGRLFAAHLGTSVSAWVRGARMREAAEQLRTSGLRVGEVARAVGFSDQLYFSRVFRTEFGVPPSRYGQGRIRP